MTTERSHAPTTQAGLPGAPSERRPSDGTPRKPPLTTAEVKSLLAEADKYEKQMEFFFGAFIKFMLLLGLSSLALLAYISWKTFS